MHKLGTSRIGYLATLFAGILLAGWVIIAQNDVAGGISVLVSFGGVGTGIKMQSKHFEIKEKNGTDTKK